MAKRKLKAVEPVRVYTEDEKRLAHELKVGTDFDGNLFQAMPENLKDVVIGLDISTTTIGICVLDYHTSDLVKLFYKRLDKFEDEYEKGDNFSMDWIEPGWDVKKIYIEAAAKKFSAGLSSAQTIMTLGRFNGIISYMVYERLHVRPVMVNVRSARAKLGIKIVKNNTISNKQQVLSAVQTLLPNAPWPTHLAHGGKSKGKIVFDKQAEDMADSWIITKGGLSLGL